jgi:hypothetical protein
MKTTSPTRQSAGALVAWIPLLATVFAPALFAATDATIPAVTEPKTHTLYMGADLDLQLNQDYCRVRDVSGSAFIVRGKGKEISVPMNGGPITLKLQQSLKLTEDSATIAKLKGERAYTPANDPYRKFNKEQPGFAGDAAYGKAEGNAMVVANAATAAAGGGTAAVAGGGLGVSFQKDAAAQAQTAADAAFAARSDFNNVGVYAARLQRELAQELFDAMDVTFEVSSEKPLTSPYVVIITRYHERDSKPGTSRNWIYAKALEPIDSTPRKVRVVQGGFPAGFEVEEFKIHLYDHGQELATNVADKRVPLTREEAFQYLKIEYLSSHKGATLPPDAALGKLPADFRTRLAGNQAVPALFVQVSKDGLPVEAFVDGSCSRKVDDPYVRSAIMDLRFQPALDQGKAVEGTYRLNLTGVRP